MKKVNLWKLLRKIIYFVSQNDWIFRRKGGVTPAGGDTEDPLGLDVEGEAAFPEDQLQVRTGLSICMLYSPVSKTPQSKKYELSKSKP